MTGASLLAEREPRVADLLAREHGRERATVRLIASENYVSAAVLAAHGTSVIERYATGRPSARRYPGCAAIDELERLAVRRAVELFGAEHDDLQPSSGSVANLSGHLAVLRSGDAMLVPGPGAGGHPSHGALTQLLQTPGNEQALRRLRAAVASVARHACPSAQHGVETHGG